jgi:hypothetical protein
MPPRSCHLTRTGGAFLGCGNVGGAGESCGAFEPGVLLTTKPEKSAHPSGRVLSLYGYYIIRGIPIDVEVVRIDARVRRLAIGHELQHLHLATVRTTSI